ncbi:hypothetical protein T492DRAFT_109695 [Pavlovales sp. CCMP2436]|nr:hypothetical protein T492DRAFT_109695 [Pavlovales sp. CCMP2436]
MAAADTRRRREENVSQVAARKREHEDSLARAFEEKDRSRRERDVAEARRKADEEVARKGKAQEAKEDRERRVREDAERKAKVLAERETEKRDREELFRRKKEFDEEARKTKAAAMSAPPAEAPPAVLVAASAAAQPHVPDKPAVSAVAPALRAAPPPPPAAAAVLASTNVSSAGPGGSLLQVPAQLPPFGARAGGSNPGSDGSGYPISEHKSSDDDEDEGEEEEEYVNPAKKIPAWAAPEALNAALQRQFTADPDDIFSNVETCSLVDIFAPPGKEKKERYNRRGSSGNWKADQLTWREVHEYNQAMGYYKGQQG